MVTGSGDIKFKTPVPAEFSHPHSPKYPRILQKYFEINRLQQWFTNFFQFTVHLRVTEHHKSFYYFTPSFEVETLLLLVEYVS